MTDARADCTICRGPDGDSDLFRVQVWEDGLWRLTLSVISSTPGFSYLEPKRHIPHITDLDGEEARTLGGVLARCSRALKQVTGAELVWIYVFGGGIPHLHLHLAPHRAGDALNAQIVRGELVEEKLPSGATLMRSKEFPPLPEAALRAVAERVRAALRDRA